MRRLAATLAVAALGFTACGGDDDDAAATTVADTTSDTTVPADTTDVTEPADDTVAPVTSAPTDAATDDTSVPETAVPTTEPEPDDLMATLEVPVIDIATPTSGGGERPLLQWAAVDGATAYRLVVLAEGEPYWAWVGRTASVPFGGGDPGSGPGQLAVLTGDAAYTWTVTAWDDGGNLLGASAPAPIAP
jgi:hypothetical protein